MRGGDDDVHHSRRCYFLYLNPLSKGVAPIRRSYTGRLRNVALPNVKAVVKKGWLVSKISLSLLSPLGSDEGGRGRYAPYLIPFIFPLSRHARSTKTESSLPPPPPPPKFLIELGKLQLQLSLLTAKRTKRDDSRVSCSVSIISRIYQSWFP